LFADADYWIALFHPREELHSLARTATAQGTWRLVTTDWVLVEVLNYFADKGEVLRQNSARACDAIRNRPNVEVRAALRSERKLRR
jgi:predicted nucleic acid-binding protein